MSEEKTKQPPLMPEVFEPGEWPLDDVTPKDLAGRMLIMWKRHHREDETVTMWDKIQDHLSLNLEYNWRLKILDLMKEIHSQEA